MHETDAATDPETAALAEGLRRAVGAFVRAIRKGPGAGRTAQDEMLGLLARDGAMSVATMAQIRNVAHQTMRSVAAQAETASLISGDPDPNDRRSRLFTLTETGRAALARGQEARASAIGAIIRETLSAEERDMLYACVALLERLTASAEARLTRL